MLELKTAKRAEVIDQNRAKAEEVRSIKHSQKMLAHMRAISQPVSTRK